jgi:hypothetical protein
MNKDNELVKVDKDLLKRIIDNPIIRKPIQYEEDPNKIKQWNFKENK